MAPGTATTIRLSASPVRLGVSRGLRRGLGERAFRPRGVPMADLEQVSLPLDGLEAPRLPVDLVLTKITHGADIVLASGIGHRAVSLLESRGIEVRTGVPSLSSAGVVWRGAERA